MDLHMRCRCGQVRATVANASARTVNRVVCYCIDCQAFAHRLGRADLLDAAGGTDIVQVAPATLRFEQGSERLAGLRLSPKGLHRFYAACCNTPVGNTAGPFVPFIGLFTHTLEGSPRDWDGALGQPRGAVFARSATLRSAVPLAQVGVGALAHVARLIVGWLATGQGSPNPFFDRASRQPLFPMATLSAAERDALRPLCGPRAATPEFEAGSI